MGLFNRKKDTSSGAPKNYKLSTPVWVFGRSSSGKMVNEKTAMQLSAVYACVRVISESIASLPLDLFRFSGSSGSEKDRLHPLYSVLHNEPNAEMTSFTFRETLMSHQLLWGNAYAQIIRNARGQVTGLYPLLPDRMTVERDDETKAIYYVYRVSKDNESLNLKAGEPVKLTAEEVLHIPGLGFDGLIGYSPIAMMKNSLGAAIASEEYGSKFFENGATPAGVLEHPGVLKDPEKLRKSWQSAYGGSGNAGKTAILEEGLTYKTIGIAPKDAQMLEMRRFSVEEIARIFRVPPHMIGDLERATFSNIEHQSLEFVKYTLGPWMARWEQAMDRRLLNEIEKKDHYIQFNAEGLLRGDLQSRNNAYAVARQNGWMSANDIRRKEGMDLIPAELGGDRYLCNGNMVDIATVGKEAEK